MRRPTRIQPANPYSAECRSWASVRKRPNLEPTSTRVENLEENIRDVDIVQAREMISTDQGSPITLDILRITHDLADAHRDRDFRTISVFLGEIKAMLIHEIRIAESNARSAPLRYAISLVGRSPVGVTLSILRHIEGAFFGFELQF